MRSRGRASLPFLTLTALSAVSFLAACAPERGGDTLVFREISARVLPTEDAVLSAIELPDSAIAYLTRRGSFLLLPGRQEPLPICEGSIQAPIAISWDSTHGVLGLVDANTGIVWEATQSGDCNALFEVARIRDRPDSLARLVSAAAYSGGWLFLYRVGDRAVRLDAVDRRGAPRWTEEVSDWEPNSTDSSGIFVASGDSLVFIVSSYFPFPWTALDFNGTRRFAVSAYTDIDRITWDAASPPLTWRAVSVVQVGDRAIQTLADLNSDAHRFVTYDVRGKLLRIKELIAPVGFIGRCEDQSCILALRRTNALELVRYEY